MLIVDLSKKGFPAAMKRWRRGVQSNPFTSRQEMQAELSRYMPGAKGKGMKASGENKKTAGSRGHDVTGSNLKLAKSRVHRGVAYVTTGLALTSANYLARFVRDPAEQARVGLTPEDFDLTADDVAALAKMPGVCPGASAGCMAVCLVDAGQQGTPTAKVAQIRRHLAYTFSRDALCASIAIELVALVKKVQRINKAGGKVYHKAAKRKVSKAGKVTPAKAAWTETLGNVYPAVRLNVDSDIAWETVTFDVDPWLAQMVQQISTGAVQPGKHTFMSLFERSEIIFYDYTKIPLRFRRYAEDPSWPSNYFLTFSLSELPANRALAAEYIRRVQAGERLRPAQIAVPFVYYEPTGERYIRLPGKTGKQWPLPKTLTIEDNRGPVTAVVLDGDPSDARFDDAAHHPASFAGLRFKEILAKSSKATILEYDRKHVQPAIDRGFLLKAPAGLPHVIVGVGSYAKQAAVSDADAKARLGIA